MKWLEYLKRAVALPFFAGIVLISVVVLYFKYLINFIRFGGEAIAYTHKNERKTIRDIYNKLENEDKVVKCTCSK